MTGHATEDEPVLNYLKVLVVIGGSLRSHTRPTVLLEPFADTEV